MNKIAERFDQGIDRISRSLNAFFERCEAYGKRHAVGIGRAAHILKRIWQSLALVILLYITLFQQDGYRYLLNTDTTHTALYTLGVLVRCFILPVGTFAGLLVTVGPPFRPLRQFLVRVVKEVASGILIVAAATGFLGYCFEYSVVITVLPVLSLHGLWF